MLAYLDDLIVYSKTTDLYEWYLHWTFKHLHGGKLYAGRAKCIFDQTQVKYLGHIVGGGVIAVDPAKRFYYRLARTHICKTYLTVSRARKVL